MSTAAITFDQIERRADHTLAFVYGAKHVKNIALCAVAMAALSFLLRRLTASLSADKLEVLSREQAADLRKKLQELHALLVRLLDNWACKSLTSHPLFRSSISGLEESTEDLHDVIEDLVFAESQKFRTLLSDSVRALSSVDAAGLVGRV